MSLNRDSASSGWACTDCLFLLANGEDRPDHMTPAEVRAWLADVERITKDCEVTLGLFREDHECATNYTVTYRNPRHLARAPGVPYGHLDVRADDAEDAIWQAEMSRELPAGARIFTYGVRGPARHDLETESDRGGECECEQLTFTWSACDVCGSSLGGARDAVVFWLQPGPTDREIRARVHART
jgi:hypothetical protein